MYEGWRTKIAKLIEQDKSWLRDNIDEVETVLHLYTKIADEINILDENNKVISFKKHHDLINHWFEVRIGYYTRRIARKCEFIKLDIIREENKLRYLERFSGMKLSGMSSEAFNAKLENEGFMRFREYAINNIKFNIVPTESIISFVTTDNADEDLLSNLSRSGVASKKRTYKYLKSITTGATSTKGIENVKNNIAKYQAQLAELQVDGIEYKTFRTEVLELNNFVNAYFS
jgi:hypothetical protein